MTDQSWRQQYAEYINSARWRNMRKDMIRLRGNKCERHQYFATAAPQKIMSVWGKELTSDLELLCSPCHMSGPNGCLACTSSAYDDLAATYAKV